MQDVKFISKRSMYVLASVKGSTWSSNASVLRDDVTELYQTPCLLHVTEVIKLKYIKRLACLQYIHINIYIYIYTYMYASRLLYFTFRLNVYALHYVTWTGRQVQDAGGRRAGQDHRRGLRTVILMMLILLLLLTMIILMITITVIVKLQMLHIVVTMTARWAPRSPATARPPTASSPPSSSTTPRSRRSASYIYIYIYIYTIDRQQYWIFYVCIYDWWFNYMSLYNV